MADSDPPWEPPLAGTEAEHLVGALDRLRTTFRWKAGHLDAAGLRKADRPLLPDPRGPAQAPRVRRGLHLRHEAERRAARRAVGRRRTARPTTGCSPPRPTTPPRSSTRLWDGAVERSRARLDAALADGGLDQLVHVSAPDGRHASLRRLRLRPDRGVRPPHRARRPAPRGRGRAGRRGPPGWVGLIDPARRGSRPSWAWMGRARRAIEYEVHDYRGRHRRQSAVAVARGLPSHQSSTSAVMASSVAEVTTPRSSTVWSSGLGLR